MIGAINDVYPVNLWIGFRLAIYALLFFFLIVSFKESKIFGLVFLIGIICIYFAYGY